MAPEDKTTSGQEKDAASQRLLNKLKEQLYSASASARRQAAFNLSWMQEDGLEILKAALFSGLPATTKNAAAYGLRKMRGRMKKMALDVFKQGLGHRQRSTREVCKSALSLMTEETPRQSPARGPAGRIRIQEVGGKNRRGVRPRAQARRGREYPGNRNATRK
jgi:hypothetical protein